MPGRQQSLDADAIIDAPYLTLLPTKKMRFDLGFSSKPLLGDIR